MVLSPADLTDEGLLRASEGLSGMRFSLAVPEVTPDGSLEALNRWAWANADRIESTLFSNLGHLGLRWPGALEADFGLNISNRPSLVSLRSVGGVARYTPSVELTSSEIIALEPTGVGRELIAFGRLPMMFLRHCPIRAKLGGTHVDCHYCDRVRPEASLGAHSLVDRTGARFPLRRLRMREGCVVRVLNSVPVSVLSQRARLPAAESWRLMFEGEPAEQVTAVVRAYRAALDGRECAEVADSPEWAAVVARHTTGHYFRGVT